jgi:methylase of polypeptide subunit release factors
MHLANTDSELSKALLPPKSNTGLHVLELGTGCGMVGITLAQTVPDTKVILTDLPEAREIVERNMDQARKAKGATLEFQELDWDDQVSPSDHLDLIIAADCTYNPDSR